MRLTILGNNGPYPAAGGACSSYLLESDSGSTAILVDCGAGALARLEERLPIERLDAVVLSHLHYDHMSDMLPLHYALQFRPRARALDVYASRSCPARKNPTAKSARCWKTGKSTSGRCARPSSARCR